MQVVDPMPSVFFQEEVAMRVPPCFILDDLVREVLSAFTRKYTISQYLSQRAKIVLLAAKGLSNQDISRILGVHPNSVSKWRSRFNNSNNRLTNIAKECYADLWSAVSEVLKDEPRSGAPHKFNRDQVVKIRLLSCQSPFDYGVIRNHWTLATLRKAVVDRHIVDSISIGGLYHILESAEIKPWKIRYYLHSKEKYEDYEEYSAKIKAINELYGEAAKLLNDNVLIYCTDEMTGIQALERAAPNKKVVPGMCAKEEFNYIRHGTTSLIGFFCVQTGRVMNPYLKSTRTADDFVEAIAAVIDKNPEKEHAFVLDNLNIHKSVALVQYVARKINYTGSLGVEKKTGILKNKETRTAFLCDTSHPIRFYFVPIHCSWMNQIEIWFGILNRQLIRHNSFRSVEELEMLIREYITQYNELFAHPYNWTYNNVPSVSNFSPVEMVVGTA